MKRSALALQRLPSANIFTQINSAPNRYIDRMDSASKKLRRLLKLETSKPSYEFNGRGKVTRWTNESNELHRDLEPALITEQVIEGKTYITEEYFTHGIHHRAKGPARIFKSDDVIKREEYWIKGKLHNESGPAIIEEQNRSYFLNGKKITFEELSSLFPNAKP